MIVVVCGVMQWRVESLGSQSTHSQHAMLWIEDCSPRNVRDICVTRHPLAEFWGQSLLPCTLLAF